MEAVYAVSHEGALHLEDVNLVDVAHRVVESVGVLAERRGTRLVVRALESPCVVEADIGTSDHAPVVMTTG